jgi:hypothetical protein
MAPAFASSRLCDSESRIFDVSRCVVTVRNGNGGKDRTMLMPDALIAPLAERVAS